MRIWKFLVLAMFLVSLGYSAFVYGSIYGHDLEKINKTAIKIQGKFSYQVVTENANYSIFLPEGEYRISASSFDGYGNLKFYVEEKAMVGKQDQRVDLVLKPVNDTGDTILIGGLVFVIAIAAVFLYLHFSSKQHGQDIADAEQPMQAKVYKLRPQGAIYLDEDAKKVLEVLGSFENRATQKELKEVLKFSDAKLSLILTELEQLGHVKKFKRGRANIVKRIEIEHSTSL